MLLYVLCGWIIKTNILCYWLRHLEAILYIGILDITNHLAACGFRYRLNFTIFGQKLRLCPRLLLHNTGSYYGMQLVPGMVNQLTATPPTCSTRVGLLACDFGKDFLQYVDTGFTFYLM